MNAQNETRERAAAIWLAAGAAGLIIALVFHGPPDPDLSVQMGVVARIGCQVLTQAFATTTDMLNAA